jgi:ribonuclease D
MISIKNKITKAEISTLPKVLFPGRVFVIYTEAEADKAVEFLQTQSIVGVDTETRPSFKAGVTNKVSLLQLSTHKRCYLIRLCRTKLHPLILKILSNAEIKKIGADVAGDIRSLHALRNFKERGFIDLQQIAQCWGIEEKSLRKMSALVLGERV